MSQVGHEIRASFCLAICHHCGVRPQTEEFLYLLLWASETFLCPTWRNIDTGTKVDVESLVLMEAHPCGGETDSQIAAGAWNFKRINDAYSRYLEVLKRRPNGTIGGDVAARAVQAWARNEREAWLAAVNIDPLLPTCLCPNGYLGRKAWNARIAALPHTRR